MSLPAFNYYIGQTEAPRILEIGYVEFELYSIREFCNADEPVQEKYPMASYRATAGDTEIFIWLTENQLKKTLPRPVNGKE